MLRLVPKPSQLLFQAKQTFSGDLPLPESVDIPQGLIGYALFLFPGGKAFAESVFSAFAALQKLQVFRQIPAFGLQLAVSALQDLPVDLLMLLRKSFLLPVQGFQRVLHGLKILLSGLHPRFQQGNLLLHLHQGQPVRPVAEASQQILLGAYGFVAVLNCLQLSDLLRRVLDPLAHASVEDHALLHILDVDVLLRADIFLYEILQMDVHAEGYGALEQSGEFFHVQAAQIHIVQVPAEPFVV